MNWRYFPEIEKKELRRMVKSLTGELSSYMSMVQRVHHTVKEIFLENGKLNRFIVARIYSRKHLTNMRTAGKKVKEIKDGKR
jgi:hypothetical protein